MNDMNVKKRKTRNSSIELLRIVAMIDITLFHYLSRNYNLYAVENSRVMVDANLWEEMIVQYIGYLGVPCFMFISGYYGIRFKWNKFATLVEQCFFYGIMSFLGLWCLKGYHPPFYDLLAINNYWFMVAYLMVMLMSPALNAMIEQLDYKQLLLIVVALYAVNFGGVISGYSVGGGFVTLMMIYLVARWMRLYLPEQLKKHSVWCFLILLLIQVSLVSACYLFQHIGIKVIIGSYDNIVNILIVGFLVITIEKYHFNNKFINYVALSTLSVYLLSESGWGQIFFNDLYIAGGNEFQVLPYLLSSVIVFAVIIVIDKIRILIRTSIFKVINLIKK